MTSRRPNISYFLLFFIISYHFLLFFTVLQNELLRTFNCGVGMVLVVDPINYAEVMRRLIECGEDRPMPLGQLVARETKDSAQVILIGDLA